MRPARLVVLEGLPEGAGREIALARATVTIGRTEGDVVLAVDTVSRRHAIFAWEEGAWTVRDWASTSGIYVDDARADGVRLAGGERIRLGGVTLRFELA